MIRRAGEADIPRIVAMGRKHHEAANNPGAFDDAAATDFVRERMIEGAGVVLMSERGQIGGVLAPLYCAPSHVQAVELFWYAEDGAGAALLSSFEEWAREVGAQTVVLSTVLRHRGQAVGKALMRKGYTPQEVSFSKVIA